MTLRRASLFAFALLSLADVAAAEGPRLKPVAGGRVKLLDADAETGVSLAAIVDDLPLAHTAQLLPLDKQGELVGGADAAAQAVQVFKNLGSALSAAGSSLETVVKLNLYIADESLISEIERVVAQTFRGELRPASSLVISRLPHAGALVAADAVGIVEPGRAPREVSLHRSPALAASALHAHAAVLPAGQRIYVSGQAEPGDLKAATRKTLDSLRSTLKFLGRDDRDVVQIKAFVTPMSAATDVRQIVAEFFGGSVEPPLVLVEWESTAPIEIELIASGGPVANEDRDVGSKVEFLTPLGMTASPVFSRVARLHGGPTIYISGLYGRKASPSADQVKEIFATLNDALRATGSDMRQLAKATYYVADDDASRALNELRPKYFDPARPPAASKAMVRRVGRPGKTITLDMIAAPIR
jgi:enamine deaminase RidA (YjgF/YER057c/UK114 family)